MPSLTFVLPHWLYWSGLLIFPLAAMIIVRRRWGTGGEGRVSLPIAYLLWFFGGFVGLHRLYLRSLWGLVYIPLFLAILFGNIQSRDARNLVSRAQSELASAEFKVEHFQKLVDQGREDAAEKLAEAQALLESSSDQLATATDDLADWQGFSQGFAIAIALLLLIDAIWLPRLVRQRAEREPEPPQVREEAALAPVLRGTKEDPTVSVHSWVTNLIDNLNGLVGEFVCYWSVIAVFVYYYEVIARYVFNSPTNWAHESMFLMFGMQYLLSGAYALREDAHVRVDVIYARLSDRAKVVTDIVTSVFFFTFTGTLLATGWTFMWDSINVLEVSFTEWAIQYWPVKITIALGALLILLQGLSKLIKDILLLRRRPA